MEAGGKEQLLKKKAMIRENFTNLLVENYSKLLQKTNDDLTCWNIWLFCNLTGHLRELKLTFNNSIYLCFSGKHQVQVVLETQSSRQLLFLGILGYVGIPEWQPLFPKLPFLKIFQPSFPVSLWKRFVHVWPMEDGWAAPTGFILCMGTLGKGNSCGLQLNVGISLLWTCCLWGGTTRSISFIPSGKKSSERIVYGIEHTKEKKCSNCLCKMTFRTCINHSERNIPHKRAIIHPNGI